MNTYESLFKLHESSLRNDMMCSDEWCLGGSWSDCYGNSGNVSADDQPTEFTEFDDLLTKICPNVTMLQYKKLYRECVTTKKRRECDYYGGVCEYARYVCNLRKLYEMMIEMNLVKED